MNTLRSAEFQLVSPETPLEEEVLDSRTQLKQQVAERLAAHRSRNGRPQGPAALAPAKSPAHARANRIAAAVAERYAHSTTYRDFLAAEARRAIEEADAAAEIAARNAAAVTFVQQQLLEELDLWSNPPEQRLGPIPVAPLPSKPAPELEPEQLPEAPAQASVTPVSFAPAVQYTEAPAPISAADLTVRHLDDVAPILRSVFTTPSAASPLTSAEEEERWALDDEILFRHTSGIAEPHSPPVPIPANLIEFPRQLVAPRKSRPRHAEGPLREEADHTASAAQLRIFEVEADQISSAPVVESAAPEWAAIHLDPTPSVQPATHAEAAHAASALFVPPQTAAISLRLMAATVDASLLGGAFLAFVTAASFVTPSLPTGLNAVAASASTLLVLFLFYRTLFFTFSDATPGMRYARIGLCTFSDDNPTRSAMRRRTWAILLSAASLGIGCLWALLDDDRMSWHDRISRMYQRSY